MIIAILGDFSNSPEASPRFFPSHDSFAFKTHPKVSPFPLKIRISLKGDRPLVRWSPPSRHRVSQRRRRHSCPLTADFCQALARFNFSFINCSMPALMRAPSECDGPIRICWIDHLVGRDLIINRRATDIPGCCIDGASTSAEPS